MRWYSDYLEDKAYYEEEFLKKEVNKDKEHLRALWSLRNSNGLAKEYIKSIIKRLRLVNE